MAKHPNVNIPIRVALALIVVRLAFFFADYNWPPFEMVYAFCAFGALIPLSIYGIWPRGEPKAFLQDLKVALKMMLIFGIIMFIFTVVFYAFIDTSFVPERQTDILKRAIHDFPNKDVSKLKEQVENNFSLLKGSSLLLIIIMAVSVFYAVFFSVLKRLLIGYLEKKNSVNQLR